MTRFFSASSADSCSVRSHDPVDDVGTGVPDVEGTGSFGAGLLAGMGLSVVVPRELARDCDGTRRRRERIGGTRARAAGSMLGHSMAVCVASAGSWPRST